jgi:hypothetical protein
MQLRRDFEIALVLLKSAEQDGGMASFNVLINWEHANLRMVNNSYEILAETVS